MISLVEIVLYEAEEETFDLSSLGDLDDEIEKALKELPQNEALLTLAIAAPFIIKGIAKIINSLVKSNGIDSSKNKPKAVEFIQQTVEKINSYVDTGLGKVLGRFIKDEVKKKKAVSYIKAVTVVGLGMAAGLGIDSGIEDIVKELAPDIAKKLVEALAKGNSGVVSNILKVALETLGAVT
jgi:hypothetical protein